MTSVAKSGTVQVTCKINGKDYSCYAEPRMLLVHFIRDELNLTGTHIGCDTGHCGACTIMMNGKTVKSCMVLAIQANGANILTVEGLAQGDKLHPIQEALGEPRLAVWILYAGNANVIFVPSTKESGSVRR